MHLAQDVNGRGDYFLVRPRLRYLAAPTSNIVSLRCHICAIEGKELIHRYLPTHFKWSTAGAHAHSPSRNLRHTEEEALVGHGKKHIRHCCRSSSLKRYPVFSPGNSERGGVYGNICCR